MSDLGERVRRRLREEMTARHLSQQDVADILRWTQSRVAQKLTGRTPITLTELEGLCFAVGIQPSEMVRDQGLEFSAEMTPTELRLLQQIRAFPKHLRESMLMVIAHAADKIDIEQRSARPLKKKIRR